MTLFGLPEPALRLGAFVAILALMMLLEALRPKRALRLRRRGRWPANVAIVVLGMVAVRAMGMLAAPLAAVVASQIAARNGLGLFNGLDWSAGVEVVFAIVLLDFAVWSQHWLFHHVPLLWRLHRVHHADRDLDVTTALRFHPAEILLSMLIKVGVVFVLGPPAVAVLLFEIILNGCAMFSHANLHLPPRLDRFLRAGIVTPDMHRVHHSVHRDEHLCNFGFNLSAWDRLFGTYAAQPRDGHQNMTIGLTPYQTAAPGSLWWSLKLPFARDSQ